MSLTALVPLLLSLGICLIPVWLLRHSGRTRAQDYLVASPHTRPEVVRNASIAYALRMVAIGPLFVWGASGELWPAIVVSACFGLGIYLIHVLRRPLLEFLDGALSADESITVHAFIARQHGNDPRVRMVAATLTLFALFCLFVGETLALAAFVRPLVKESATLTYWLVLGGLLVIALSVILSGHSGIMHSSQQQLGMLYLSLFGSTLLLLYLQVSARTPLPSHGTLAVVVAALCSAIVLGYRSSKYIDTGPVRGATASAEPLCARGLSRFEKILNVLLSILLILIILLAIVELHTAGWPNVMRDSAAALKSATRIPGVGLVALGLLPLFYPLTDITNWLRLAATQKETARVEPRQRSAVLRGVFGIYAAETSLMLLFMCMFGAIAATAVATKAGSDIPKAFVAQLIAADNAASVVTLTLFLICVFMVALSTMSAMFTACLSTVRYDVLETLWPELAPGNAQASTESTARHRSLIASVALVLAAATAFCIADTFSQIDFTGSTFVALLSALCCAQLSFAPLILGAILGRKPGGVRSVSPRWAMIILVSGAVTGVAAVVIYLVTGVEAWLWSASPACLGSGGVLFIIARATSRRPA
ncbi:MAG: hypothetical protein E6H66_26215 [Betaproteobacteria bacterium]|nr:MAG: hypothetical protein E6H66_26215 [Betaproteobacteria bacterium]